jgi:hypothetical protein
MYRRKGDGMKISFQGDSATRVILRQRRAYLWIRRSRDLAVLPNSRIRRSEVVGNRILVISFVHKRGTQRR